MADTVEEALMMIGEASDFFEHLSEKESNYDSKVVSEELKGLESKIQQDIQGEVQDA